jgi:hypothetical protein
VLDDDQLTDVLVAVAGVMVAVNVSVPPTSIEAVALFKATLSTATVGLVTVTVHVAVLLPSAVVTVIVAVPAATAVTTPFATVATSVFDEAQLTALLDALSGERVAVNVSVCPVCNVVDDLFSETLSTLTVCSSV